VLNLKIHEFNFQEHVHHHQTTKCRVNENKKTQKKQYMFRDYNANFTLYDLYSAKKCNLVKKGCAREI